VQAACGFVHVAGGGGAGSVGITRQDGVDDGLVLLPHLGDEFLLHRFIAAGDGHRVAQVLLQVAQQAGELRVAGGVGHRLVEGQVFIDGGAARGDRRIGQGQRVLDGATLGGGGAHGSQRGHFAFQRPAHFHHVQHAAQVGQHAAVEIQRAGRIHRGHEHARALACHQQAAAAQPAHRLAHDGAGHGVLRGQRLFSRQALAGLHQAGFDLAAQVIGQLVRQPLLGQRLGW
jgi:hypothetical protein